jgi:signal transduction histidine kinase
MRLSIQSRVLGLVGAGVFVAAGVLALLSRDSLLSLEQEVTHEHERLAASVARDIARAVGDDLRLLSGSADAVQAVIDPILRFGRLADAAFVLNPDGTIAACEPAARCPALPRAHIQASARNAMTVQRPIVTDAVVVPDGRVLMIGLMPFRSIADQPTGAAGFTIDTADRRLKDLLHAPGVSSTEVSVELRDGVGALITSVGTASPAEGWTTVLVAGTPWVVRMSNNRGQIEAIVAFRRRTLWLAPTLALIAMVLGWGIARSVRQPLIGLTDAAERIAKGKLDRAINTERAAAGGAEVARLAMALERMRQALQASIGEIECANRELEQRVADRTRQLAAANASLEDRERLRQQLLRKVITAQEDERKRVARELHDETSQTLAALGMGVDMALAASTGAGPGNVPQRLQDVRRLVDRMHEELHRLIVNLRPSVLDDLGLAAAIRWFAERQLGPAGVAVRYELWDVDVRLPSEVETAIFRAAQEAIVNVGRHSGADTVLIQGSFENGQLTVEIEDDGCGFEPAKIVESPDSMRGVGLLGMRERLEILSGTVNVDSAPGEGTRVVLSVPVALPAGGA